MKPMRFPRRFPWLIVFLIAVGPVLFSVPLTIWYSFTMPPLERYYYDAYFNSTALKNSPSATTDVQWIFKTAPGRTEELAGPTDVVSGSSAHQERLAVPMKLSPSAQDAGSLPGMRAGRVSNRDRKSGSTPPSCNDIFRRHFMTERASGTFYSTLFCGE
jgi:hypothetical protein